MLRLSANRLPRSFTRCTIIFSSAFLCFSVTAFTSTRYHHSSYHLLTPPSASSALLPPAAALDTDTSASALRHQHNYSRYNSIISATSSLASSSSSTMRGVKKENLPSKICVTCGRPFTWRKKWEKVWDEVSTCSKSCNRNRKEKMRQTSQSRNREVEETADADDGASNAVEKNAAIKTERATSVNVAITLENDEDDDIMINTMGDQLRLLGVDELQEMITGSALQDADDDNEQEEDSEMIAMDANERRKAERKASKKAKKAARRAEREGNGDVSAGQKECDRCSKSVDLLIRCQYTESKGDWHLICGKCWNHASGGVVDGDANHPDYKYGGLWKNRRKQQASHIDL